VAQFLGYPRRSASSTEADGSIVERMSFSESIEGTTSSRSDGCRSPGRVLASRR